MHHVHVCVYRVCVCTWTLIQFPHYLGVVEGKIRLLAVNAGSCWLRGTSVMLMCITEFHFVP